MDAFEAIEKRRSVRKYKEIPLEWDLVGKIIEAGKKAPSSGNIQDWRFVVVSDKTARDKIAEICVNQLWMAEAPIHIIVVSEYKKNESFFGIRGERLYSIQNCAAAIENMLIAATALNIGSCWIGAFNEDLLKDVVGVPGDVRIQAVITLGYADEITPKPPQYTIHDVTHLESYGNKVIDPALMYLGETSQVIGRNVRDAKESVKNGLKNVNEKIKKKLNEMKEKSDEKDIDK